MNFLTQKPRCSVWLLVYRPETYGYNKRVQGQRKSRRVQYTVRANYVLDCAALNVRLAMQIDHFYTSKNAEDHELFDEDATVFIETRQSANLVNKRAV